jgi:hemerythrin-like domain-containing protein
MVRQSHKPKTRATEIAKQLADNKLWHSHGRKIGVKTLVTQLRLKIQDYSQDVELRTLIRSYHDFLVKYIERENYSLFLHSRNYFGGDYEMSITAKVKTVIEEGKARQSNLQRLHKLVKEKEESGILQRKQYEIPSIDKVGRYFRQKFLNRRKAH